MSLEFEFIRLKRGYLTATKDLKIGEQKAAVRKRVGGKVFCAFSLVSLTVHHPVVGEEISSQ